MNSGVSICMRSLARLALVAALHGQVGAADGLLVNGAGTRGVPGGVDRLYTEVEVAA